MGIVIPRLLFNNPDRIGSGKINRIRTLESGPQQTVRPGIGLTPGSIFTFQSHGLHGIFYYFQIMDRTILDKVQKEEQEVTFPLPGSNPPVDKPLVFPYFEILLFSPGLLSKPRGAISDH